MMKSKKPPTISDTLWTVGCTIPRYPGQSVVLVLAESVRSAETKALRWMRRNYEGKPIVQSIERNGVIAAF
jgi:hypothetical protein